MMFNQNEIDRLADLFVQTLECRPWEMDEIELPENTLYDSDLEGENDNEAGRAGEA